MVDRRQRAEIRDDGRRVGLGEVIVLRRHEEHRVAVLPHAVQQDARQVLVRVPRADAAASGREVRGIQRPHHEARLVEGIAREVLAVAAAAHRHLLDQILPARDGRGIRRDHDRGCLDRVGLRDAFIDAMRHVGVQRASHQQQRHQQAHQPLQQQSHSIALFRRVCAVVKDIGRRHPAISRSVVSRFDGRNLSRSGSRLPLTLLPAPADRQASGSNVPRARFFRTLSQVKCVPFIAM